MQYLCINYYNLPTTTMNLPPFSIHAFHSSIGVYILFTPILLCKTPTRYKARVKRFQWTTPFLSLLIYFLHHIHFSIIIVFYFFACFFLSFLLFYLLFPSICFFNRSLCFLFFFSLLVLFFSLDLFI